MGWSFAITVLGAILGTAPIVGGLVVYGKGTGTGAQVFGAVTIAVGVVHRGRLT